MRFFFVPGTYVGSNILKNLEKLLSGFLKNPVFEKKSVFLLSDFGQTILSPGEFLSDSLVGCQGCQILVPTYHRCD